MFKPRRLLTALCLAAALAPAALARQAATGPGDQTIRLDLPQKLEVGALVQYVSGQLGFNVVYDAPIGNTSIALELPKEIRRDALLGLLQSVLRANNLVLVDGDQPGFKRIVAVKNLLSVAPPPTSEPVPANAGASSVVTRVFQLQNADPAALDAPVKALLSTPGGNSFSLPEQRLLIVSDFADNVRRIGDFVRIIDTPNRDVTTAFVTVRNAAPAALTEQLQKVLTARLRAQGAGRPEQTGVEVVANPRTGQLALLGPKDRVDAAKEIVASLDVATNEAASPIRFYKLANTTAADLLATIRAIEGEEQQTSGGGPLSPYGVVPGVVGGVQSQLLPGTVLPPGGRAATSTGTTPPPGTRNGVTSGIGGTLTNGIAGNAGSLGTGTGSPLPAATGVYGGVYPGTGYGSAYGGQQPSQSLGFASDRARVAADPNTNTIIVIAEPPVQAEYEQLISRLDRRRPQVLLEASIVTLDTSRGYQFGVDVSYSDTNGDPNVIAFDSFGISRVNPVTGRLAITPQLGFNAAVLSSDVADVVLRALATDSRARVYSAPRVLVNDNAEGRLSSVAESPFTSVNASQTVATTSFAGYARAGTTIRLVPHISEDEYLQLEYEVELSSFTGAANQQTGLPPPRQENSVQSEVTIPDGFTIVVGGLRGTSFSEAVNSVPILGQIPLIKYLFSSRQRNSAETSLYVFIRPTILRDDRFEDLKYLSGGNLKAAGLPGDLPQSEPLLMQTAPAAGGGR